MLIGCYDPVECTLSEYYDSIDREIEEEKEKELRREEEMEELNEKLFNIKQNALRELKKAQYSIREAYNCVSEYNSEIYDWSASKLIDMNFLDSVSRKVQEIEQYAQWTTEERVALENEGRAI